MLTHDFVTAQGQHLLAKKKRKLEILKEGGQQALSHSYKDIVRIDYALKRIEDGQYGLCTNCGCTIGEKRLEALPETPFCVSCAAHIEAH